MGHFKIHNMTTWCLVYSHASLPFSRPDLIKNFSHFPTETRKIIKFLRFWKCISHVFCYYECTPKSGFDSRNVVKNKYSNNWKIYGVGLSIRKMFVLSSYWSVRTASETFHFHFSLLPLSLELMKPISVIKCLFIQFLYLQFVGYSCFNVVRGKMFFKTNSFAFVPQADSLKSKLMSIASKQASNFNIWLVSRVYFFVAPWSCWTKFPACKHLLKIIPIQGF